MQTDQPLLTTKLHPPILRREVLQRSRLIERLSSGLIQKEGFVRKLTLVSAAAGFGKTTLIGGWIASQNDLPAGEEIRSAWLSLDGSDNDPRRFLFYLVEAIRQLYPDFGTGTEQILQSPQPPPSKITLTSLINELSCVPEAFILVLDDYHTIHTATIHEAVTFLLDNQPANLHLVILTREDPLLPMARLRARGQLLEIRQGDLRFNREETGEFLLRETGISLDTEDVTALERHTEGWAAGLQLAALSMRGRDDLRDFIQDFTASDRYILDYLLEEVFDLQSSVVQEFLLQTCILNRLTGPLCEAVTGLDHGKDMLRNLEQANLFIVPLDPGRTWYRYHHLFADLLRHRLRSSGPAEAGLHQRASRWFESEGFIQEAVEHSIASRDWGNAARLIGVSSGGLFKRGELIMMLDWLGRIPPEVTAASLGLCLNYAWAALLASQFELATPLLERAKHLAQPDSHELGSVAAGQAYLARARHDSKSLIENSEQALALLRVNDVAGRGNVALNLGLAYWHEGRIAEAGPVLEQACELAERAGNFFALLTARIFLARIHAVQGRLHKAAELLEALIREGRQIPVLCLAHYDLATLHIEWNDLATAAEQLKQGINLSLRSGNLEFQQSGQLIRAILALAQGDEDEALASLEEAEAQARDFPTPVRSRTAAFGVQLALVRGDPLMLTHWTKQVGAEVDAHSFYRFMGLTTARLLIARGEKTEAGRILDDLFAAAAKAGWGYGSLVVRVLQSLSAKSTDQAVRYLFEALKMGGQEGFIRSFVDAGPAIIPLLREAYSRSVEPDYTDKILSAMGAGIRGTFLPQSSLVEALTDREVEVLRLVTEGFSNREIAMKLFISPGTAKTHIHNLCGKLGARNRTEAAVRARELGLA